MDKYQKLPTQTKISRNSVVIIYHSEVRPHALPCDCIHTFNPHSITFRVCTNCSFTEISELSGASIRLPHKNYKLIFSLLICPIKLKPVKLKGFFVVNLLSAAIFPCGHHSTCIILNIIQTGQAKTTLRINANSVQ